MSDFNPKLVEQAIAQHKDRLLDALEVAVATELRALKPRQALTLRLVSGDRTERTIEPGPNAEYAKALLAFMKEREYKGCSVDSIVTPLVLDVVEREVLEFYSSQEITEAVVAGIVDQVQASSDAADAVRSELRENMDWLRKEYTAMTVDSSFSLAGASIDASSHALHGFLASEVGKTIMASIAHALTTATGKVALQRMLMVVVKKTMASAAIKSAIYATIKKVGISVLIKTAVGKAFIALLAAAGIAHVPVFWVLLPIIAGFMVIEYTHFPAKLAKKVPGEIRSAMNSRFGDLNERVTHAAVQAIFATLAEEFTKVRNPEDEEQRETIA